MLFSSIIYGNREPRRWDTTDQISVISNRNESARWVLKVILLDREGNGMTKTALVVVDVTGFLRGRGAGGREHGVTAVSFEKVY